MEPSEHNWANISKTIYLPWNINANFRQVGLLDPDVVLS